MTLSVLFWNIWGHRDPSGIRDYLRRRPYDLCCLTEVTSMGHPYSPVPRVHTSTNPDEPPSYIDGLGELQREFSPSYNIEYATPAYNTWQCRRTGKDYHGIGFGSALLERHGLEVLEHASVPILQDTPGVRERMLQYVVVRMDGHTYVVAHLHGIWIPENTKGDDPRRDEQSRQVLRYLDEVARQYSTRRIIFGGDLNLALDTDAITILERGSQYCGPLRNLIREDEIDCTRTPRYRKFYLDEQRHADYVFVSREMCVYGLAVGTATLASDHAPLWLTCR